MASQSAPAVLLKQWPLLLLLLLTGAAYCNSFAGTWQFDDFAVLLRDPRVQSFSAWWQSLPHIRPLFKLSVAFNHEVGGTLFHFHLLNLSVHLGNTVLVYLLGQTLLRRQLAVDLAHRGGLLVAMVFALHPAQTEAVTYLSGRSVALEACGVLLAAWSWLRAIDSQSRRWYVLTISGLLIAVASRETAIVTPLLLWLLGRFYRATESSVAADVTRSATGLRNQFFIALLLIISSLALLLCLPRYRELLWLALQWQNPAQLIAAQTQALLHLLAVAIGIAPLNADPALFIAPLSSLRGMLAFALVSGVLTGGWFCRRRLPLVALGVGWLAVVWLPTHSLFLRLDPVNDRQLYLAFPGLVLALTGIVSPWLKWQRVALISVLGLALLLAALTFQRNEVYRSEIGYWQDVVQKAPHNARGWNNLGVAEANAGNTAAAERAFKNALVNRPDYVQAAVNLKLLRTGHWRRQESESDGKP